MMIKATELLDRNANPTVAPTSIQVHSGIRYSLTELPQKTAVIGRRRWSRTTDNQVELPAAEIQKSFQDLHYDDSAFKDIYFHTREFYLICCIHSLRFRCTLNTDLNHEQSKYLNLVLRAGE
jgi:hypothetical protein